MTDIREQLEASAGRIIGAREESTRCRIEEEQQHWARRVIANIEANAANGAPITAETRKALQEYQAAMTRLQAGPAASKTGDGNIIPACAPQVKASPSPSWQQNRRDTSPPDFHTEYLNVPYALPESARLSRSHHGEMSGWARQQQINRNAEIIAALQDHELLFTILDEPEPKQPDPVILAEEVRPGRPKRRILRKKVSTDG